MLCPQKTRATRLASSTMPAVPISQSSAVRASIVSAAGRNENRPHDPLNVSTLATCNIGLKVHFDFQTNFSVFSFTVSAALAQTSKAIKLRSGFDGCAAQNFACASDDSGSTRAGDAGIRAMDSRRAFALRALLIISRALCSRRTGRPFRGSETT